MCETTGLYSAGRSIGGEAARGEGAPILLIELQLTATGLEHAKRTNVREHPQGEELYGYRNQMRAPELPLQCES